MKQLKLKPLTFEEQSPPITMPAPKVAKVPADDGSPWIELITGSRFYFNAPAWDIGAIAHSLSLVCRFNGQCRKFYSVAEHSVLVSRIMEDQGLGDPMEGLLHDGVESVLSDVVRPAKMLLKDYQALDATLDRDLRKAFVLPETPSDGCKKADRIALLLEAKALMPSKGLHGYVDDPQLHAEVAKLPYLVNCWTSDNAKEKFMTRMSDIRRRVRGLR